MRKRLQNRQKKRNQNKYTMEKLKCKRNIYAILLQNRNKAENNSLSILQEDIF